MKPHIFAEMLGSLRELAFHFGTAEQFRDRASTLLQQYIQVDGGIPADRVPGEGMVAVDRQLLLDVEDALGRAEGLGPCGLGLLCQVQDTLRANQEGAEHI